MKSEVPRLWFTLLILLTGSTTLCAQRTFELQWTARPAIPDELGVAGPIVGTHNDVLIVAGGANFARPVWESQKQWHDETYVLTKHAGNLQWQSAGKLPWKRGYAACVSTPRGVLCMGGNDDANTFDDVWLLQWNGTDVDVVRYPPLPQPCVYGSATLVDNVVFLAGGQRDSGLDSAMNNFWKMQLLENPEECVWEVLDAPPWSSRAFNLTLAQHNGFDECVYVISGRRQSGDAADFLRDVWEFNTKKNSWRRRQDVPSCVMAGTGIDYGTNHLLVLGGADGSLFAHADELQDDHPGFPRHAFAYHTVTDTWVELGETPANHVTTHAVHFDDRIVIPSGEIRPRVRSNKVWGVSIVSRKQSFGLINYSVLFGYLGAMVLVGVYFARRNRSTDDYFRGGKQIPWWAAGCSIYATMLSSLTYTGIPSKSFQQDWVVAIMNFTVPVVAFAAIYVALPFYRRIDATSAYEYLERRFSRVVRWFGSLSFTMFHVFRMAVVLSLTGLALDVATPLSPAQAVLLMGVLSIVYCTVGGIEAVIWTDTIQTCVLLGGAILAVFYLIGGIEGGWSGFLSMAEAEHKFKWAHHNFDVTSAQVALWAIVIGGIAQNLSTYTADQAIVQRYMTTSTEKLATRSIWMNAIMVIPTTILFFGIGTALFAFYRSQPERLDATIAPDQVFPLFIANELPIGVAGLIVAGIFAAAQSTVSTSMNSMATTTVTDLLRPLRIFQTEHEYLRAAKILTLLFGIAGTVVGLAFIDPRIRSLFDEFIKVLGVFMGVLGGLFMLGALTRRANATGAMVGATVGAGVMIAIWVATDVTAYLYTFCGISSCFVVGYLASMLFPAKPKDLAGLTIYTLKTND